MGSGTFRGGIHPYDGKELSRDRVIQDIRPGKELAYRGTCKTDCKKR